MLIFCKGVNVCRNEEGIIIVIIVLCISLLLALGVREQIKQKKNVAKIPIRVNVNGIRGKSTVTRMITAVITEAGYKTIGKTTGTAARMIYWFDEEEEIIKRKPQGANISEQLRVIDKAAKLDAEALVCECMAVNPEYQEVFQCKMLQATIGVIVNVLEDHMDVMGPTLDQVAQAFTTTIPYNGYLVTVDGMYTEYFKRIAKERNTKVIVADNSKISEDFLSKFDYMVFPENVSLALAVGEALGIDKEICLRGMLNAHPDPGAMRITSIGGDSLNSYFVNGFAANDPQSTLKIWERVLEMEYDSQNPIVVMNCRPDRVDRTKQFADDVLPHMQIGTLISIGGITEPITTAFNNGKLSNVSTYLDLENASTSEIMEKIYPLLQDTLVYGIGNIHGSGEPFIESLLELDKEIIESEELLAN
ncbi:poly-gamma-glutamate synthase PgsB/CapB [Paeniclostridium ghonii]|uniref:Poly-gamma-glutamate synthase PgsB/CapB n=1 Tax=Paraclostridium ghonii TaxID=29358 RepID=A0ABU0MW55_9FIRM|nr:poly-gamma-glutamate synthase PgsB/CapB [Paeniclostridium ghonii]